MYYNETFHDTPCSGCNGGEVLLTHNRTLAPRRLVQASDFLTTLTRASRVYDSGITWCTYDRDVDPYVDMEFTSPVLITMMISSGSVFNQNRYYVTNFTLEYSPPNNSSMLNYYLSADDSVENGSVKVSEIFEIRIPNLFTAMVLISVF